MYKIPVSVLVVIYTADLQVLLLERTDHPGYWQSVTGSQDPGETLIQTASREVFEETGLHAADEALIDWRTENRYEIYEEWRWRYGPGVRFNTEHVFGLRLPGIVPIRIAAREHLNFMWLPWQQAADKVFSSSNAEAILKLPEHSQPG
ncbi:MAG: dihydroneopterin triphosphate diphosphatase [Nitrosomonadaceae bacterium]|nr:dihydroneopterin triphosphate diphosphatase [Nitrosomonadaceae bacterium]